MSRQLTTEEMRAALLLRDVRSIKTRDAFKLNTCVHYWKLQDLGLVQVVETRYSCDFVLTDKGFVYTTALLKVPYVVKRKP